MKKLFFSFVTLAVLLAPRMSAAYEIEFFKDSWKTNGVVAGAYSASDNSPVGWTFASDYSKLKLLSNRSGKGGVEALGFDSSSCPTAGKIGELKMGDDFCVPREEIVCDNIVIDLELYVYPISTYKQDQIDKIQLLATTNGWTGNPILIGEAIPLRDASYVEGWRKFTVKDTIVGVSNIGERENALKLGIQVISGRSSYTYGYVHGLAVAFKACATPNLPALVSVETNEFDTVFSPGERGRMRVEVDASPTNKIGSLEVCGVLSRCNGQRTIVITNVLENASGEDVVGGVYYEKLSDVANRDPFDAGETVACSVIVKYKTNDPSVFPYGKIEEDGFAYEYSDPENYEVGKWGSVWINEVGRADNGECFVEFCGTTNRTYVGGWQAVLSGTNENAFVAYTNVFVKAFDFTANTTNGVVGLETHRWADLDDAVLTDATLELINSAGIVEFCATNIVWPSHCQMTGRAKWRGATDDDWSYDWTGTSTNGTFQFEKTENALTPDRVNVNQGFLAPVKTTLYLTTVIDGSTNTLSYASVGVVVDGILNGEVGVTNFTGQTAEGTGTATIEVKGYSDDASQVIMSSSVAAFAWKCDDIVTTNSLYEGDLFLTNIVKSTVAYDDFSSLKGYWENWSNIKNMQSKIQYWGIGIDGKRENVLQLDTRSGYKGYATLTTKSYMDVREKKYLDVSFDFVNESDLETSYCTTVKILIADSPEFDEEVSCATIAIDNKSTSYGKGVPYSFRQFIELPLGFAPKGQVWVRIYAVKNVQSTSVYTTIDNLRVAAVDSVEVESLDVPALPSPTSESVYPLELPSAVELNLSPLTGGIVSNVEERIVGYEVTTNGVPAGMYTTRETYEAFLATLDDETEVSTQTNVVQNLLGVTTNAVRQVAADLVMTVNGNEFAVPFRFDASAFEDSLTNDISAVHENVLLTIAPAAITDAIKLAIPERSEFGGFLPGDKVSYYARVTYDPDDADPSGARDVRYSLDNATATETGWYVKSKDLQTPGYLPVESVFNVSGPDVNPVGAPTITDTGFSWTVHAWSAAGLTNLTATVTNLTGTVNVSTNLYAGPTTSHWTGAYEFNGLDPNTEYFLSITGNSTNGVLTSVITNFVTLPQAPTATITADSTSQVTLTVGGSAASYEVSSGWTKTSATTWTKSGLSPNSAASATVWALNKNGGKSAPTEVTGYTLAATATKAPVIEKGVTTVAVSASKEYATATGGKYADGNPEGTEYAVRVTTSNGGDALVMTNSVEVWQPIACWTNALTLAEPTIDLSATNTFSLVTRNAEGVVTENANPVTTNCWFAMETKFVDDRATQVANPFGTVDFAVKVADPAKSSGATVRIDAFVCAKGGMPVDIPESGWMTVTNNLAVTFDQIEKTTDTLSWNAWQTVGQAKGEYDYRLRVRVASATRSSEWAYVSGSLDFAPPVVSISGTPAQGATVNVTAYDFSFSADEAEVTFNWNLDGTTGTGATKAGSVVAGFGTHTLGVTATDKMGNVSEVVTRTWTVDTVKPVWSDPAITGTPAYGTNTVDTAYELTASATDKTALTYHWTLRGSDGDVASPTTGAQFSGNVAADGVYTAQVYAVDAAGNVSPTNSWIWTRDTTPPTLPQLTGTPAKDALVNVKAFSLTATSEDVSPLVYHWTLNGVPADTQAATFAGEAAEGANTVSVYATDVAGNVSPTNYWAWSVDTTRPTDLNVTGLPINDDQSKINVTNGFDFAFTASATDATALTFHWKTNGVEVTDCTGSNFVGKTGEGTNTVTVFAKDAAGNSCSAVKRTWVVDTINPTTPVVTGTPANGATTKVAEFSLTAASTDATILTYHWTLHGSDGDVASPTTGATLTGTATEGANAVSVYAEDEAGNTSATANWSWTLDTVKPTVALASATPDPFNGDDGFVVTATFSETVTGFSAASVSVANGTVSEVAGSGAVYTMMIVPAADGEVSVQVPASAVTDAAGNGNTASMALTRTFDNTQPTVALASSTPNPFAGKDAPLVVMVTFSEPVTNFTAASVTVGNGSVEGAYLGVAQAIEATPEALTNEFTVVVLPADDGEVTVQVAAGVVADMARNGNAASAALARTYDTTPPGVPVISGTPVEGAYVNVKAYDLTAKSTDATALTYHWTLCGSDGEFVSPTTGASFSGSIEADGVYTAMVYAVDAAGNKSETASRNWTLDTTPPVISLETSTAEYFNAGPLVVRLTFSEVVTGFSASSVVVENGAASVTGSGTSYTVNVDPTSEGPVVISIPKDAVADAAGNGNATVSLTRIYDVTPPAVTLTSETPLYFNAAKASLVVTATFSEPVTNFTAESVTVGNGTVKSAYLGTAQTIVATPEAQTNVFTVVVLPTADGVVSVQVAAGVVADRAANANVASEALTRTYDNTPPTVELSSDAPDLLNATNLFAVTVRFSEPVTNFTAESIWVDNGTVTNLEELVGMPNSYRALIQPTKSGEVSVQVIAGVVADAAGNGNEAAEPLTRTCDITLPTVTISSPSAYYNESNLKNFSVKITFSETVSEFTSAMLAVENGTATVSGSDMVYTAKITPNSEGKVTIRVPSGVVTDAAGNGNVASGEVSSVYDNTPPTPAVITVVTNGTTFTLTAKSDDANPVQFAWFVNDAQQSGTPNPKIITLKVGESVRVYARARDAAKNWADETASKANAITLTGEQGEVRDVEFGGGVTVAVDPKTGETNSVGFTALDFKPGEASTFKLRGFSSSQAAITGLQMWFVTGETLGGVRTHVSVNGTATFDSEKGELTVTLPAEATQAKDSLFIFGVDNKSK